MVQGLLRGYSVLFHLVLSLFCFGIAFVGSLANSTTMQTDFLPWSGVELRTWLYILSLTGLAATLLAVTGLMRFLLLPWTLIVVFLIGRALWATRYYSGPEDLMWSAVFLLGAVLTVFGAFSFVRRRPATRM